MAVSDQHRDNDCHVLDGVDLIIAQSGVAKTTFYRYFPAKDDLVVAYLEARNQWFWAAF
jgi:AcrR family transcriptional regulator